MEVGGIKLKRKKKAVVISFFRSNNIGDLALSKSIEDIIGRRTFEIAKYDFVTTSKMDKDYDIKESLEIPLPQRKSKFLNFSPYKSFLKKIVGESKSQSIIFNINTMRHKNKWRQLEEDIKSADIIYIGGGNMVMDLSPDWPIKFAYYISLAKKYNKICHIIYVGIGPIFLKESKEIFKKSLRDVDFLSVRDSFSKEYAIETLGLLNVIESVDPVFFSHLTKEYITEKKINRNYKKIEIGVCVLSKECFLNHNDYNVYIDVLTETITNLSLNNVDISFTLFSTEISDYKSVNLLYSECAGNPTKLRNVNIEYIYNINDVEDLYKKLHFLIGGRMHSLIFAQKFLLPYAGIIWQKKLEGFAKVAHSSNRLFEIKNFSSKDVSELIAGDLKNKEVLLKMQKTNEVLDLRVNKGILDESI